MGSARPRLMSSVPAITVDATAPRPTVRTPSLPEAGSMWCLEVSTESLASRVKPLCYVRHVTSSYRVDVSPRYIDNVFAAASGRKSAQNFRPARAQDTADRAVLLKIEVRHNLRDRVPADVAEH